jgi:hypothetical protein
MLVNTTRPGLSADEFARLAELAKDFYANIPAGIELHGNWASLDGTHTYALLGAPDQAAVERMQAPFEPYVDSRIVAVRDRSGWEVS